MKRIEIPCAALLLLFGCASDSVASSPNRGFAGNTSVFPPIGTGGARAGSGGAGTGAAGAGGSIKTSKDPKIPAVAGE